MKQRSRLIRIFFIKQPCSKKYNFYIYGKLFNFFFLLARYEIPAEGRCASAAVRGREPFGQYKKPLPDKPTGEKKNEFFKNYRLMLSSSSSMESAVVMIFDAAE